MSLVKAASLHFVYSTPFKKQEKLRPVQAGTAVIVRTFTHKTAV